MAGTGRVQLIQPAGVRTPMAPYSHALVVEAGRLLFIAGQGPSDHEGRVVGVGDMRAQARQVLANIEALLEAAGGGLANLVEMTIYVRDMQQRPLVTEVRRELLKQPYPTATMIEIAALANPDWLLEISAVAAI